MTIDFQLSYVDDSIIINNALATEDVARASSDLWIQARNSNPIKRKNYNTQRKIVSLVYDAYKLLPDSCGRIMPNEAQSRVYEGNVVEFRIGAPMPWLMKLAPEGHFIYDWRYAELYQDCDIDESLVENLSRLYLNGVGTKYLHNTKEIQYQFDYILFAHQSMTRVHYYHNRITGLELMQEIKDWANDNKKHVVFRMHPTSGENYSNLEHLVSEYTHVDTTSSIVRLVSEADQVWTVSSAVGFEGMLMNKPVTIFGESDYHPAVNSAQSVEEAYHKHDRDKYLRFITWYTKKLCINIHSPSASDRVHRRLYDYFIENKRIDVLY